MGGPPRLPPALRRLWADESGAQSLEFVALLPMVLLTLLLMLQMALLAYTLVVAESSAREAARTAARDQSLIPAWRSRPGETLIDRTARQMATGLPVTIDQVACAGGQVTVVLSAGVPNVLFESAIAIRRSVTMPTQEGGCA